MDSFIVEGKNFIPPFFQEGAVVVRERAQQNGESADAAEAKYWMGLFGNQVNLIRTRSEKAEAVATYWLSLLLDENGLPR